MKWIYIWFISFFLISCEKDETNLVVENRTNHYLYCAISTLHPDTSFSFIDPERLRNDPSFLVAPFSTSQITNVSFCDNNVWSDYVHNDTIILFAFDKEIVDNFTWTTIKSKYILFQRQYITFNKLSDNKCKIIIE